MNGLLFVIACAAAGFWFGVRERIAHGDAAALLGGFTVAAVAALAGVAVVFVVRGVLWLKGRRS
jgi:hypothetical protein